MHRKALPRDMKYHTHSVPTSREPKSVKVTNNRTDKKTVSGFARYQKYYVRVRSYTDQGGKTYNGAWSDKKWVYTQ